MGVKSTSYFKHECEVCLHTFKIKLSESFEENEDEVGEQFHGLQPVLLEFSSLK
jgi:hypothetical protein